MISAPSVESDVTEFPSYPSVHHTPSIKSQQPLPYTGPSPSSSSSLSFVSAKSSSLEPFQDPVVMASTISTTNNPTGRLRSNSNKAPNQISISKLNFIYYFVLFTILYYLFFFISLRVALSLLALIFLTVVHSNLLSLSIATSSLLFDLYSPSS